MLLAVCLFLSKITLLVSILKSFDLNLTFSCNKILSLFKKLPSFAVMKIFFDSLLIANLGSAISTLDKFLSMLLSSILICVNCLKKIIVIKIKTKIKPI